MRNLAFKVLRGPVPLWLRVMKNIWLGIKRLELAIQPLFGVVYFKIGQSGDRNGSKTQQYPSGHKWPYLPRKRLVDSESKEIFAFLSKNLWGIVKISSSDIVHTRGGKKTACDEEHLTEDQTTRTCQSALVKLLLFSISCRCSSQKTYKYPLRSHDDICEYYTRTGLDLCPWH